MSQQHTTQASGQGMLELVSLDSELVVWLVVVRLVAVVKPCHPIPLISPMIKRVISE